MEARPDGLTADRADALLAALPCGAMLLCGAGKVLWANPAARALVGSPLPGEPLADLLLPATLRETLPRLLKEGGGFKGMAAGGGPRDAFAATVIPLPDDATLLVLHPCDAAANDARGAERALRASEDERDLLRAKVERNRHDLTAADRRFAELFEFSAEPLFLLDPESLAARRVNGAARRKFGALLAGRREVALPDLFPGDAHPALRAAAAAGESAGVPFERPDGTREVVVVEFNEVSGGGLLARATAAAGEGIP